MESRSLHDSWCRTFLREKWKQVLEHSQFNAKAEMDEIL